MSEMQRGRKAHRRLGFLRYTALAVVLMVGFTACSPGGNQDQPGGTDAPVTISMWRTFDGPEVFDPILADFKINNPNITIEYRELPLEEYELVVSEALAAGEGPDIWSIRNDSVPRHQAKLVPMPEGLLSTTANQATTDEEAVRAEFVPVVAHDVVRDGRVYGLPYYVDTLVIFRNETIFNDRINELELANRTDDAELLRSSLNTYDKLQRAVALLTERDGTTVNRAGIAAGTANNVREAEKVVYAMMLQNGTEMVSPEQTNASFHLGAPNAVGQTTFPGTEALLRYTSFADPASPHYSWNASMPSDIQAFAEGKVAMIFGFQYYELILNQIAPTLRYKAMPLPQVRDSGDPIDYASYWVETVTKNADNPELAWQVVRDLTSQYGANYRAATGRPNPQPVSPIPTIIERATPQDPFQFQQQTATSWYKTKRPDKVDGIFRDLIQRVATKQQAAQNAIEEAAQRYTQVLQGQ